MMHGNPSTELLCGALDIPPPPTWSGTGLIAPAAQQVQCPAKRERGSPATRGMRIER